MDTKTGNATIVLDNQNTIKGLRVLRNIWIAMLAMAAIFLDALVVFSNLHKPLSATLIFGFILPWILAYFMGYRIFKFKREPSTLSIDDSGISLKSPGRNFTYAWSDISEVKMLTKDNVTGGGTSMATHRIKLVRKGTLYENDNTGTINDEYDTPIADIGKMIDEKLKGRRNDS